MNQFDFNYENNPSESDLFENPHNRKFSPIEPHLYTVLSFCLMPGEKINTKLLYTKHDKQLFTFTDYCANGRTYRCQNRSCPARVLMLPSGQCVKLNRQKEHNHDYDCENNVKKINALTDIKKKCKDLQSVASGRRLAKVTDIYTQVMIK